MLLWEPTAEGAFCLLRGHFKLLLPLPSVSVAAPNPGRKQLEEKGWSGGSRALRRKGLHGRVEGQQLCQCPYGASPLEAHYPGPPAPCQSRLILLTLVHLLPRLSRQLGEPGKERGRLHPVTVWKVGGINVTSCAQPGLSVCREDGVATVPPHSPT